MQKENLLKEAINRGASDIHLISGNKPILRIHGSLMPLNNFDILNPEILSQFVREFLNKDQLEEFYKNKEMDIGYMYKGDVEGRFRINIHFEKGNPALSLRLIPKIIPTLDQINMPQSLLELTALPKGLIIVTGATGSGKSTTLASLIDYINQTRGLHIVTIEDPIEYVYSPKMSIIEQRELHTDTLAFSEALKRALRQDPDVILLGEMRDLETISTAITAAETGHLVFSTLHTNDSVEAIDRLIDIFSPNQQQQIRIQLSMVLEAVIAQQLLPRIDKQGRVPSVEILRADAGVRNLIRQQKTHEIYSLIEIGANKGMKTMEKSLVDLVKEGKISKEEAFKRTRKKEYLENIINV